MAPKPLLCDINKFAFPLISLQKGRITKGDIITQNLVENGVAGKNHTQLRLLGHFFYFCLECLGNSPK